MHSPLLNSSQRCPSRQGAILVPNSHLARGNGLYVPLSLCLPWFFFLCLSTSLDSVSACLSVCLSLSLSLPASLSLSALLSQSVSIFLCLRLSVSVFQFLSVLSLSLCIFLWPTECFSIKLSLFLFLSVLICLSVCLPVSQYVYLCFSVSHTVHSFQKYTCAIFMFSPQYEHSWVFSLFIHFIVTVWFSLAQAIDAVLVSPILQKAAEGKTTVTVGIFLLLLVEKLELKLDVGRIQFLCHCLLIRPEMNNTTCADLDNIASHFPMNMADSR